MRNRYIADWLVLAFFAAIVALVFQQIATSMQDQGIASGGPYDNSAAYPRWVAILIAAFIPVVLLTQRWEQRGGEAINEPLTLSNLARPLRIFGIFLGFLILLPVLGYYIAAPLMLLGVMYAAGLRGFLALVLPALAVPFLFAFVFEAFLHIVLPGGWLGLHIGW
ncbi:tripartite tricarboxylate transporter TctB family protein [Salipiger abyssi]|uniref:tripartite tricarboxylate transporter TctB family protein n=1 Tax=Salipiger abyssi TaxID=1250539 RepID=UPI001A8BFA09|nr:tripartite tricarboxylate transporter TctB family protein [Salipiger abyssi]MBN9888686.1 tripartite tricarboxylate transporter TctB family protein [Salipiger abyssi]